MGIVPPTEREEPLVHNDDAYPIVNRTGRVYKVNFWELLDFFRAGCIKALQGWSVAKSFTSYTYDSTVLSSLFPFQILVLAVKQKTQITVQNYISHVMTSH